MNVEPTSQNCGKRLQQLRRRLTLPGTARRMSQSEFAKLVKISRERLASYEGGYAPLNLFVGWEVCRRTGGSQLWLATGGGPAGPFLEVNVDAKVLGFSDRTVFLEGVVKLWEPLVQAAVTKGVSATTLPPKPQVTPPGAARPLPPDRVATGKLRVTAADRLAGQMKVKLEFLPGCAPETGPAEVLLIHPGVEAVDTYLSQQRQGSRASLHLLRLALLA
jgi:hypothetical protein